MIWAFAHGERRLFAEIETGYPGAVNLALGEGAAFITTDDAIWRTST